MGPLSRGMVIGVSLSEPHTNRENRCTLYVCIMYVCSDTSCMCIIIVVKIINVGHVLTLNIAHQNMQLASIQEDG